MGIKIKGCVASLYFYGRGDKVFAFGEDSRRLPLTSELDALCAGECELAVVQGTTKLEKAPSIKIKGCVASLYFYGRGDKIRTCDFYVPKSCTLDF